MEYTSRKATPDDLEWAYALFKRLNRHLVEELAGEWPEPFQSDFFRNGFEDTNIIEDNGRPIGIYCIQEEAARIHLSHMHIDTPYQGWGIGTAIMEMAVEQAHTAKKPLELEALINNHSAIALYQRRGFEIFGSTSYEWVREHRMQHVDTVKYRPEPAGIAPKA